MRTADLGTPIVENVATCEPAARPPAWFDRLTVGATALVLGFGTAGLLLGALGVLNPITGLVAGSALAAPLMYSVRHVAVVGDRPTRRGAHLGAALALGVAVVAGGWASWQSSEHLLVDRDPGAYTATAKWLASGNDLRVTDPLGAFGNGADVDALSEGVFEAGNDLEFQFSHLPAGLPALVGTVTGDRGLLATNGIVAALGLLALYSFTVRATGRALLSVLAPTALAVSMPFVAVTRDVYSEPYAFLFLWTGLLLLTEVATRPRRLDLAMAAGLFTGATLMARVDSVPYLILLVGAATVWVLRPDNDPTAVDRRVAARTALRAAAAASLLGIFDLLLTSTFYAQLLASNLLMLWFALAFVSLSCLAMVRRPDPARRLMQKLSPHREQLAWVSAAVVSLAMLSLWVLRPHLQTVRITEPQWFRIVEWQAAEGVAEDTHRTYAENSFVWMSWYLGVPTVALAIAGLAAATWKAIARRVSPPVFLLGLLTLSSGAVYWWRPSILPDQIWATRRFLPAVLPGLVVLACVALGWILGQVRSSAVRAAVAAIAAIGVLVPPLAMTARVPLMAEQRGMLRVIDEACELLGDDAAVLVVGGPDVEFLPQTLRSWCGVPTAVPAEGAYTLSPARTRALAATTADRGRRLRLVSSDPAAIRESGGGSDLGRTAAAGSARRLEHTLTRPPSAYLPDDEVVEVRADYSLSVAAVPAN